MCGAVQLTVDILIILQIIMYSREGIVDLKNNEKTYNPIGVNELSTQY